jgi:hypothetical protein
MASLYNLGTDHIENTALPSNGPTVLYCDVTCSLPLRGIYRAVAKQRTTFLAPLFRSFNCHVTIFFLTAFGGPRTGWEESSKMNLVDVRIF